MFKLYDLLKHVGDEAEGEDNSKSHFLTCVCVCVFLGYVYVCLSECDLRLNLFISHV